MPVPFAAAPQLLLPRLPACCARAHSCPPPARARRRDAATGELRIGIFATRPIAALEELTYDYQFEHSGVGALARGFKCMCGAKNCRCARAPVCVCVCVGVRAHAGGR